MSKQTPPPSHLIKGTLEVEHHQPHIFLGFKGQGDFVGEDNAGIHGPHTRKEAKLAGWDLPEEKSAELLHDNTLKRGGQCGKHRDRPVILGEAGILSFFL